MFKIDYYLELSFSLSSSLSSNMIISGHWDKKIRFWDLRVSSVNPSHELAIQGRVTSLSLFPGRREGERGEG